MVGSTRNDAAPLVGRDEEQRLLKMSRSSLPSPASSPRPRDPWSRLPLISSQDLVSSRAEDRVNVEPVVDHDDVRGTAGL